MEKVLLQGHAGEPGGSCPKDLNSEGFLGRLFIGKIGRGTTGCETLLWLVGGYVPRISMITLLVPTSLESRSFCSAWGYHPPPGGGLSSYETQRCESDCMHIPQGGAQTWTHSCTILFFPCLLKYSWCTVWWFIFFLSLYKLVNIQKRTLTDMQNKQVGQGRREGQSTGD